MFTITLSDDHSMPHEGGHLTPPFPDSLLVILLYLVETPLMKG
jgi:hypothetical protein